MAAYQNTNFAYQGTGLFAYQVGAGVSVVSPSASSNWGKSKRKKKRVVEEEVVFIEPASPPLLDVPLSPQYSLGEFLQNEAFDKDETEEEDNMLMLTLLH